MTSETRSRSSSSPPPPPPPPPLTDFDFSDAFAMEATDSIFTRRSTRSFVESELDADLREFNASSADSVSSSSYATSAYSSSAYSASDKASGNSTTSVDFDGYRQALTVDTGVLEEDNGISTGTGTASSAASSSHASSALASPSTAAAMEAALTTEDDKPAVNDATADAAAAAVDEVPSPPGAPVNFGFVMPGIFRSSYPQPENFEFLSDLNLKTIVTLVDKNYTEEYAQFITGNGIQHHIIAMKGTKKEDIPLATMESILSLVLDRRNYPLLIHCNQGRHRTGCVVGIMRAIAGWDREMVTGEYCAYAGSKVRECDVEYIRAFALSDLKKLLARDDLQIDRLIVDSRVGGPMVGRPPPTTLGFRVPNFFRSTFFSMTVLLIWMVSGSKMPSTTSSDSNSS